jgi:hypothetical protein
MNLVDWPANTGAAGDVNIFLTAPLRLGSNLTSSLCDMWDRIGYD